MPIEFGCCSLAEVLPLTAALDQEFISARGRTGSLRERFPAVLNPNNLANIFVARSGNQLVGSVVVRPFQWFAERARWRGAMIGLVYTRPDTRGTGIASALLAIVTQRLTDRGFDFAVLWSGLDGFYEERGWIRHDISCLGRLEIERRAEERQEDHDPRPGVAAERIEALRGLIVEGRLPRSPADYQSLPLPASSVRLALIETPAAYLLYGIQDSTRFVYELMGDTRWYAALWRRASAGAATMYVNDVAGSVSHHWLSAHTAIHWQAQRLTFWRWLNPDTRAESFPNWYIPYFDRI